MLNYKGVPCFLKGSSENRSECGLLMLFVTVLIKAEQCLVSSDSYRVAHNASTLSAALTAVFGFCLQGGVAVFKDLGLN